MEINDIYNKNSILAIKNRSAILALKKKQEKIFHSSTFFEICFRSRRKVYRYFSIFREIFHDFNEFVLGPIITKKKSRTCLWRQFLFGCLPLVIVGNLGFAETYVCNI